MGLASALSTALTGLNAAETSIDVAGNNISNANTVGFKQSSVTFATQFLQTQSLGSAPTGASGGTNPSQTGLGVEVVETSPDFSQGTIQNTSNSNDLAIQGEGFFIVQSSDGQQYYTRDGEFTTNANSELVNSSGNLVLGQSVNSAFQIQSTQLSPITLPLGSASTAEATTEATLQGTLPPGNNGAAPATGSVIASQSLSDGSIEVPPDLTSSDLNAVSAPDISGTSAAVAATAGALTSGGTYQYEVTYSYVDSAGNVQQTQPSGPIDVATTAANQSVTLTGLAPPPSSEYTSINIYRTDASGAGKFYQVGSVSSSTTSFNDTMSDATLTSQSQLNTGSLAAGSYSYYVAYFNSATGVASRPASLIGPLTVAGDGGIQLSNIPTPDPSSGFNEVQIYRDTSSDASTFYKVATLPAGTTSYIDTNPDSSITSNPTVNLNGPAINSATNLVSVVEYANGSYSNPFAVGTLSFTGAVGTNTLATKTFNVTSTTTVGQFAQFLSQSFGIQTDASDPTAGFSITSDGHIQLTGDVGTANALNITTSSMSETLANGTTQAVNLNFGTTQAATGQSTSSNFVAYDSLGTAVNVTITAVLLTTSNSGTTYRWYASSGDNQPTAGANIAVGTGTITFDGSGNLASTGNTTVSIDRSNGATSPLQFKLNFSQVSGLSNATPSLDVSTQDGTAPGTLSSYSIGSSGLISGTFSNGITQTLGQIQLAKFANNDGLVQAGNNLYSAGVNSGLPIVSNPGTQGIGAVTSGAIEESNTDVGENLINLITASTTYQGGAQVISTVQQLYQVLLNLRTG